MNFEVAPLPYAKDSLVPVLSPESFQYHYEKHHKGYMTKLKGLIQGKPEAEKTLEEVVRTSSGAVFNDAAQVWNHSFFWESLTPGGGGAPERGDLADLIQRDFGGWEKFREAWKTEGMARFGSGWVWLVVEAGRAKIITTPNAETPLTTNAKPLITCDVWEHAYYIDFRDKREGFLEAFCDKLINWDFAQKNLKG